MKVKTVFELATTSVLGRQEMMESGFFRPFVTPNGASLASDAFTVVITRQRSSTDTGDTILYAAQGGRPRGQNRLRRSLRSDWTT